MAAEIVRVVARLRRGGVVAFDLVEAIEWRPSTGDATSKPQCRVVWSMSASPERDAQHELC